MVQVNEKLFPWNQKCSWVTTNIDHKYLLPLRRLKRRRAATVRVMVDLISSSQFNLIEKDFDPKLLASARSASNKGQQEATRGTKGQQEAVMVSDRWLAPTLEPTAIPPPPRHCATQIQRELNFGNIHYGFEIGTQLCRSTLWKYRQGTPF